MNPRLILLFIVVFGIAIPQRSLAVGQCTPRPPGLIAWWPGNGNAIDIVGTNHGTLRNGTSYAAGKVGQAFRFDGIDDFVEIAHSPLLSFPPGNTATIEFWFYRTKATSVQHFLGKRAACVSSGGFNYQSAFDRNTPPIPLNVWIHYAQVFRTNGVLVYTNAVLFQSFPGSFGPENSATLRFGTSGPCPLSQTFGGLLDEICLYDRALSLHEIQAIYMAGAAGKCVSETVTNSPPSISSIAAQTTLEDQATPPIPFNVADAETPATELKVTVTSSDQTLVPDRHMVLAGQGEQRTLTIVPAPDQFGTCAIELVVTDGEGLSARTTFELRVLPVNDPPSFTMKPDLTVMNDAGPRTIVDWATDISAGPPNEADQTLTLELTSDRPELFAAQPALSSAGTLTFTPHPQRHGRTTVTVILRDSGGTENGGVDISAPGTFTIDIQDGAKPPSVRWVQPLNYSAFTPPAGRTTVDVLLEVEATGQEPIERVDFYNGTTLVGTSTTVPHRVEWRNVHVGQYLLHVVAIDSRNLQGRSEVVRIAVSDLGGAVAIVRSAPHPEINVLQEYLFEMGLGSRIFEADEASFEALDVFRMVLLHLGADGLAAPELIATLTRLTESPGSTDDDTGRPLRPSGMPIFIIGERVVRAASTLPPALQDEWLQLSRLHPSTELQTGQSVAFAPETEAFKILRGVFGEAKNFAYESDLEPARAMPDTTVWARAGEADVFLTYPDVHIPDGGQARRATQNFQVATGGDNDSLASRKAVFQNTVCWLLHCSDCSNAALSLETSVQDVEVPAGDVFLLPLFVLNNGACEARASRLRVQLPAGLAWVGVEVPRGGSWTYDPVNQLGCVEIGIVGSGHPAGVAVDLTLRAVQPGAYEIPIELLSNNTLPNAQSRLVVVTGDAPPVLRLARLSDGRFRLHATGAGAKRYVVQQTPAVLPATAWTPLAEFTGPEWTSEAFSPVANQATFYRIVSAL